MFTLHFDSGYILSRRNFRTQRVGTLDWVRKNYNFQKVATFIDELVVLNISGQPSHEDSFCAALSQLAEGCFAPITAGGGIRSLHDANELFLNGADKVMLNKALFSNPELVFEISRHYGRQAVVGSIDFKKRENQYDAMISRGTEEANLESAMSLVMDGALGEIYANAILNDGTGQGMDIGLANFLFDKTRGKIPLILAGGAGKPAHLVEALVDPIISGAATANLLNFVGNGLEISRQHIREAGVSLATWD
jgi:cyclase